MMRKIKNRFINETIENKANEIMEKLKFNKAGGPSDYSEETLYEIEVNETEMCEQCGGEMKEGEQCEQCGMKEEVIYEVEIEEGENCEQCDQDEMEEGNAFTDALRKTKKGEKFKVGNKTYTDRSSLEESTYYELNYKGQTKLLAESEFVKLINRLAKKSDKTVTYRLKTVDGVHMFTESQMLTLIEDIVIKEEKKFSKGQTPKGLGEYERSVKKSKKENDDYIKSVGKKMKDYLKDGSKGDYEENPKHFPKGNGQLEKMKSNKYTMSDEGKDFIDSYMHPGMEDLVPDQIEYDVDWTSDNIKGSSRTGNNPKWANAEETELGEKLVKKMKDKKYHKAKMAAYRKAKQPVTDGTGDNSGSGLNIKENLDERKEKVLNEEFSKIKDLISYNRKTQ
jgi:hypothetical protein